MKYLKNYIYMFPLGIIIGIVLGYVVNEILIDSLQVPVFPYKIYLIVGMLLGFILSNLLFVFKLFKSKK